MKRKRHRYFRRATDAALANVVIVRAPETFLALLRKRLQALIERGGIRESVLADLRRQ